MKPEITSTGKIDIHGFSSQLRSQERKLIYSTKISERNKKMILDYLRDCELGKTVLRGQKKKIGNARLVKYMIAMQQIAVWLNKDFDQVTQADMETYILNLERDRICSNKGTPYQSSAKRDFKVTIRKFYKWLLGENETFPPLVRWIDTRETVREIPCLRREEIEKMSELANNPRDRAILWGLFDSGARAEEFLNIRYRNLELIQTKEKETVYRIRIEHSKTLPRTILLPIATPYFKTYLSFKANCSPETPLFEMKYSNFAKVMRVLGEKAISRTVYPHLLRHSSATYYATRLNRGSFCYRFGWSYRSDMADRYIDREGLTDQESVQVVHHETVESLSQENSVLKEDVAQLQASLNDIHRFMTKLTEDPKLLKELARRVVDSNQGLELKRIKIQTDQSVSSRKPKPKLGFRELETENQ